MLLLWLLTFLTLLSLLSFFVVDDVEETYDMYLLKSHDEKRSEDDIWEEGDEVNHFPIRLTNIKIVRWITIVPRGHQCPHL